jgi:quercetin dioxygenase-like cupin family protein
MAKVIDSRIIEWKQLGESIRAKIVTGKHTTAQIVLLKKGTTMDVHSHPSEQLGYVLEGKTEFIYGKDKKTFIVGPGMFFFFESNEPHGVRSVLRDTTVLDLFGPARKDYASLAVRLTK